MTTISKMPKFLPLLVFVEMWERFSFYGLTGLLVLFITKQLDFSDKHAYALYGMYMVLAYFGPIVGGFLADRFFGFRKMVLYGGSVIALGHLVIAFIPLYTNLLYLGLALIAVGTGMFKGNITNLLGACYNNNSDPAARDKAFTWFYVGINIGAAVAAISCSFVAKDVGWGYALGMAGLGMLISLIVFVRFSYLVKPFDIVPSRYQHLSAQGQRYAGSVLMVLALLLSVALASLFKISEHLSYLKEILSTVALAFFCWIFVTAKPDERKRIFAILLLVLMTLFFFAIQMQKFSMLTLFSDRNVDRHLFGLLLPSPSLLAVGPIATMLGGALLAPVLAKVGGKLPMLRVLFSFICMTVCFGLLYFGTLSANAGHLVNIYYVLGGVALIGIGEICISPLTLALTTLLAPRRLLGVMMGFLMLSYSFASFANFILVKFVAVPKIDGSINIAQSFDIYQQAFLKIGYFNLFVIAFVLVCTPFLHKVITSHKADA